MDLERLESPDLDPHQEDYIELENNCCLCGTELVFQHENDESLEKVKERAHCPSCHIQLKEREHIVH